LERSVGAVPNEEYILYGYLAAFKNGCICCCLTGLELCLLHLDIAHTTILLLFIFDVNAKSDIIYLAQKNKITRMTILLNVTKILHTL